MRSGITACCVACLVVSAGGAFGQNALGDGRELDNSLDTRNARTRTNTRFVRRSYTDPMGAGRVLDASLSLHSRYNDFSGDPAREMQFRNAIVTGNAPGGMSFRGDVGYAAPNEFRGELGSDSTFAFRRDSVYSGLAGMGIRGTDALQFQFAMTTGSRPPQGLVGNMTVSRSPQFMMNDSIGRPNSTLARDDRPDRGSLMGTLRSPSAYLAGQAYQPVMLGQITSEESGITRGLTASGLRGIRLTDLAVSNAPAQSGSQAGIASGRIETAYDTVLERIRERAALLAESAADEPADTELWWRKQLRELQEQLLTTEEPVASEPTVVDPNAEAEDEPELDAVEGVLRFDPRTMELLRESGEPILRFVDPNADTRDMYAEHMRIGEELLATGQYFDAEERFTRSLAMKPGDVTSQMGRVHAQIGGGLFSSASLNLRTVLIEHPEMIAARYGTSLLPKAARIRDVMIRLSQNAGVMAVDDPAQLVSSRARRESALLLAYMGFQLGDLASVRAGLDAFDKAVESETHDERPLDARLVDLLRAIWLDQPDSASGGG